MGDWGILVGAKSLYRQKFCKITIKIQKTLDFWILMAYNAKLIVLYDSRETIKFNSIVSKKVVQDSLSVLLLPYEAQ